MAMLILIKPKIYEFYSAITHRAGVMGSFFFQFRGVRLSSDLPDKPWRICRLIVCIFLAEFPIVFCRLTRDRRVSGATAARTAVVWGPVTPSISWRRPSGHQRRGLKCRLLLLTHRTLKEGRICSKETFCGIEICPKQNRGGFF